MLKNSLRKDGSAWDFEIQLCVVADGLDIGSTCFGSPSQASSVLLSATMPKRVGNFCCKKVPAYHVNRTDATDVITTDATSSKVASSYITWS